MLRQLHIRCTGAIYHVVNQGARRELIFQDAPNRARLLETLGQACARTVTF